MSDKNKEPLLLVLVWLQGVIPIGFGFGTNETKCIPGIAQTIVSFLYPIGINSDNR
jgi:hypothetical protein